MIFSTAWRAICCTSSVDIKVGPKAIAVVTTAFFKFAGVYIPPAMDGTDAVSVEISPAVVDNQFGMVSLSAPNFTKKSKMVALQLLFSGL